MKKRFHYYLFVSCLCLFSLLSEAFSKELHLVLAGDSTVANHPNVEVEAGWGVFLKEYFNSDVRVSNLARGGTSTKSFRSTGLWDKVLSSKPDYVFIQFGHNDQPGKGPGRETDPKTTYRENLKRFIKEVRDAGAQPILVTSVARRIYFEGKIDGRMLQPYVEATREVGREEAVPVLDLFHRSVLFFNQKGEKFCQQYGPSLTDKTHFSLSGARLMARFVVEELNQKVDALKDKIQLVPPLPANAPFTVDLMTVSQGYDGETCWVHPRAGVIPGNPAQAVITLQKLQLAGSDIFFELNDVSTKDDGKSWSKITPHPDTLGRRISPEGLVTVVCDFTPKFHQASGKLLGTGHTALYENNKVAVDRPRSTAYSVYDAVQGQWSKWKSLKMPDQVKFYNSGAGCTQRVDLENGDILLPIYFKEKGAKYYRSTVLRCRFENEELRYVSHGTELSLESGRGVYEPSLIRYQGKFYLTLRNDTDAYVSVSEDGQNFGPLQAWKFEDGSELGNYNTQQHWLSGGGKLYLVYNRKGAHNDHMIRHRAPLFMAEVNPTTLKIKKETEAVVVPERGARLGNFGVTEVNENESWITVAEWMQSHGPNVIIPVENAFGADNSVFVSKIRWKTQK